jgi:hypothetical protein
MASSQHSPERKGSSSKAWPLVIGPARVQRVRLKAEPSSAVSAVAQETLGLNAAAALGALVRVTIDAIQKDEGVQRTFGCKMEKRPRRLHRILETYRTPRNSSFMIRST